MNTYKFVDLVTCDLSDSSLPIDGHVIGLEWQLRQRERKLKSLLHLQ